MKEYASIDLRTFEEEIRPAAQPVILRGLVSEWPAVQAARASDERLFEYMVSFYNGARLPLLVAEPEIEGRFFYNNDMTAFNFMQGSSDLPPFLERLLRDRANDRPYAIAIQSTQIPMVMPGFEAANQLGLLPPSVIPRMWMGNAGRVAPHYDLQENIGCVVAGRRRFTLFPPDQLPNLYPGPFELTPAGTPVSIVDPQAPDFETYPGFRQALEAAQQAELHPGDAIYIPFHWWHAVDSLDPVNLFVNYWWNPARRDTGNPYGAMLHGLLSLRSLPDDQRAAWREMFDHYIFCTNGDPVAHLPQHARGFLGGPTPDQVERMRATLKQLIQAL